jgi:hypothetical protein
MERLLQGLSNTCGCTPECLSSAYAVHTQLDIRGYPIADMLEKHLPRSACEH